MKVLSQVAACLAVMALACAKAPPQPPEARFATEKDDVKVLDGGTLPASFATEVVSVGDLLPRPIMTGTVGTVETKTSPSFAPLDGRIEQIAPFAFFRLRRIGGVLDEKVDDPLPASGVRLIEDRLFPRH